jgi:hypothetical protein
MARMKFNAKEVNFRELNDAEYDPDAAYDEYDGPIPPKGTILRGGIKKLWVTQTQNGDWMFKALFEAANNTGERKQYNGCPIWDNVLWSMPQVKFRWQPFLDALGVTLKDIQAKLMVEDDEDNVGTPVIKLGNVRFNKTVPVTVKTGREKYEGEWVVRVAKWLPASEVDEDDDDADEWEDDDAEDDDDPFAD